MEPGGLRLCPAPGFLPFPQSRCRGGGARAGAAHRWESSRVPLCRVRQWHGRPTAGIAFVWFGSNKTRGDLMPLNLTLFVGLPENNLKSKLYFCFPRREIFFLRVKGNNIYIYIRKNKQTNKQQGRAVRSEQNSFLSARRELRRRDKSVIPAPVKHRSGAWCGDGSVRTLRTAALRSPLAAH